MEPSSNRCAQTFGAEVDAVPAFAICGMHDQRLQDASVADVLGELVERGCGELGARVGRVLDQPGDGKHQRAAIPSDARLRNGLGRR